MTAPTVDQIRQHEATGCLWMVIGEGFMGVFHLNVRADGRIVSTGFNTGGEHDFACWEHHPWWRQLQHYDFRAVDEWLRDVALMNERDRYRARSNLLANILQELAAEVRAQKRTSAYQRSHGRPATAGRRRIDLEKYLARAGIEVKP